jgi:superfamily II DNA or RNA helicase
MPPVKIIIGNVFSKIVGILPDSVNKELDKSLSYKIANAQHMPQVKNGHWDGVVRLYFQHKGQSFYTGLLSLVRDVLAKNKIQFELLDRRERPTQNFTELTFTPPPGYESRDYQTFTIERALKFTRGILSMATGAGKTLVVTRLIGEIKTYPFIFYVLTKDLMEQAHGVMSACLNQPIGMIGDGKCDIQKITVCTIQTAVIALNQGNAKFKINDYAFDDEDEWDEKGIENAEKAAKIKQLITQAKGICVDECHHVSSKSVRDVLTASVNAFWRYGGSATPYRDDGASILIQAMLGAKIVDVNASYLIKRGDLVKPYIFMEPVDSKVNFHSYQKIYENCIVKNEPFNNHVAKTVNHLISRGLSVLVLVQQYKHGEYLKKLIPNSEFITGKISSEKRTKHLQDLREGKITLIGTSLVDEGVDIKELDVVVMAGGGKSCTRISQRVGRCLRKDKKSAKQKNKAIVIIYEHNAKYLEKHAKRVRFLLKKEPEFAIIDSKGADYICSEIDELLGVENKDPNLFQS